MGSAKHDLGLRDQPARDPMDNTIIDKLEAARRELLDLTGRNRLINTPRSSSRSGRLEIVDELSDEVFRHLVLDKKSMGFLPKPEAHNDEADDVEGADSDAIMFALPDEDADDDGVAARHRDDRLQTWLTSEALQRRLLKLYYDARIYEEEQGVKILYLALGFLKWYEADSSDRERHAPLILVPVELDRRSASSRFKLSWTEDDLSTNLSLQEKLRQEFGVRLPDLPAVEDLAPSAYFAEVRKALAHQKRWEVLENDIVLWFFSFTKFLMYRDLAPETWPDERAIERHPLLISVLQQGFRSEPPICGDTENIDRRIEPLDMIHVMDADSSQTIAIEEVKQGRNLVIQGPPGTGKSQTITNLIATAVKEGKRVLFVAEKMAALEVVKRRLDSIGLGDMCLELHSHKANKLAVLEDLSRTLNLGRPKTADVAKQANDLKTYRDKLNRHAEILHSFLEPAHVTPFQVLGELVRLRAAGVRPAEFTLNAPVSWTATSFREKQNLLKDLALHMSQIGNPVEHAWRGVQLEAVLPQDVDRISQQLPGLIDRCERLLHATQRLAELIQFGTAETPIDAATVARLARRLTAAPAMDRQAMADNVWETSRDEIGRLIETGKTLTACREQLADVVSDVAWTTDVSAARRDLAAHGRSWFRFLNGKYRAAQATLRGILAGPPPKPLNDRVEILDTLIRGQQVQRALDDARTGELGRRAFGTYWRGEQSDWAVLEAIAGWEAECRGADIPPNFREALAAVADVAALVPLIEQIKRDLKPLLEELQNLFKSLNFNVSVGLSVRDLRMVSLPLLKERLEAWRGDTESLTNWIAYFVRWRKLQDQGMGDLAQHLDSGLVEPKEALDRFQMAYYESLMREAFQRYPELAQFNGVSHEQLMARFKTLDVERLTLARQEVAMAHYESIPRSGDAGELGIIRREIQKKRRHLPLRKLLAQAGHAVQAIKPVFMMSPISIAQFLEPGVLEFDLLLIDEASQVQPVDALGAIARARQIVVVGDDRQLPPTRFFNKMLGDDGTDGADDDGVQVGDLESILGLCAAQNMPQRMLQWHYRSRHHSLIAVSNHEFYNDRLFVVPSPMSGFAGLGLTFHYVANGVFDRGKSATNRIEAQAVADAVIQHARQFPDKTLGVGTFSVSQRDAILDEIELRRRDHPELESFFATGINEPFFVKNLENIQGDERDVIFISVGYGKDKSGYMAMNFGPLSNDGGERRLNVLITRARERCEVFSSITADDIDLNRAKSRGAQALKTFLTYARSGFMDVAIGTDRDFDSEFEREVARALQAHGFEVHAQVGVAGFFVDLAVVDPDVPGRYLLGVECDGASYHSSRSARDRDRLRQQVLEDRGWVIHRIWSTDWFHRPDEQLRKTIAAIEHAKAEWSRRSNGRAANPRNEENDSNAPHTASGIERDEPDDDSSGGVTFCLSTLYREASFPVDTSREIHELAPEELAAVVRRIVQIEGPIHQDEIARRVAGMWGLRRTGSRIHDAVDKALCAATFHNQLVQDGLFFSPPNQRAVPIRDRSEAESANLRKVEYLPPAEIRAAVCAVVETHLGITKDDAIIHSARLFGFRSTSRQLRDAITQEIDLLILRNRMEHRNERLYLIEVQVEADQVVP
ncbi:MAG: hypothetical protein KatS3mg105_5267 [Gemmatales bacterium]|nr:MAG: hypothetical protein KatS3mg105_5267 [Gemmatales bacterium]